MSIMDSSMKRSAVASLLT